LAPVVAVDEDYHEAVNAGKVEKILSNYREEE
jgi:NADH:ubiquinone oxidoreductase subunit E